MTKSDRVRRDADGLASIERQNATRERNGWQNQLHDDAFCGVVGDIVRLIEPETEADPAAILVQALVALGNVIGRGPYVRVEATRHHTNLFALVVGETSKARKGTSLDRALQPIGLADPIWRESKVESGLTSGEGLIWHVRDPKAQNGGEMPSQGGENTDDDWIRDKRLLVRESEFAGVLKAAERRGNTLSPILREAWDKGSLRTMTKNSPAKATGAHISIIGHITEEELRRELNNTEIANGFANRFLFTYARRSKLLPFGGKAIDWKELVPDLQSALLAASEYGQIHWTDPAREIWVESYERLSVGRRGLVGAITGRAEAHVLRLALLYAVINQKHFIEAEHLNAALAVWAYCDASAKFLFGDSLGDPTADEILRMLRTAPNGLNRTAIINEFGRHKSASQIGNALKVLLEQQLASCERVTTGGRPQELWRLTPSDA